jgi:hypothetical protein
MNGVLFKRPSQRVEHQQKREREREKEIMLNFEQVKHCSYTLY